MRIKVRLNIDKTICVLGDMRAKQIENGHDPKYIYMLVDYDGFHFEGDESQTYYRASANVELVE